MSGKQPTLIVTGGPLDGQVVRLANRGQTLLGSGADTAQPLALANVAPHHVSLEWDGQEPQLAALETPTGTYVNGERVSAIHALADGDRLCLGPPGSKQSVKFLVRLVAGPGAEDAEAADEALPGFEAPDLDGALDLTSPPTAAPPLVLIDPDAAEAPLPVQGTALPGWSDAPAEAAPAPPAAELAPGGPEPAAPSAPPPVPPRTETRRRPEYTHEIPSMLSEEQAQEQALARPAPVSSAPPATAAAPRPKAAAPRRPAARLRFGPLDLPRLVALAVLGLLAVGGAWMALSFFSRPSPVLESVLPPRVAPGGTVTLVGENFAEGAGNNQVTIGGQPGKVNSATDTRVTVTLPATAPSGGAADLPVRLVSRGRASNTVHLKVHVPPSIKAVEPPVALPGAEVVLTIPDATGDLKITMADQPAQVVESRAGSVRVRVPDLPLVLGRRVRVIAESNGLPGSAGELVLGKLPMLLEASPTSGPPGTPVKIVGRGFSADPGVVTVTLGGAPALVLSATPQELRVAVPVPGGSGSVTAPIEARVAGSPSNSLPFVVDRLSTVTFVLRCFAAPVPGDARRAYVATEYGPLLLISDKGPAASVGDRAVQVASALNQLADAALAGRPPVFELRDNPRPAVGVVGGAELLAPEGADVAGYGARATAKAVAGHWTGLLADTFALFVEYRRPTRLAETSSAGKLLIDMFAEAQRRAAQTGAGPGVPRAQLFPLAPALERQLRDLALQLPGAPDKGAASVVVEGTWEGTMTETGAEPRPIQLNLRRAGGRLTGSLSTASRGLQMGIPLGEASYEKGTLRFTLQVGGVPRVFSGTLQGALVSGSITSPASKEPLGTFTLNFVK